MKLWTLVVIALVAITAGCRQTPQNVGAAVDHDGNVMTGGPITGVTLQDLPAAVKQTLIEHAPHAEVAVIEKSKQNGALIYKITFTEPDKTPALYVGEDGTVLPEPTKATS
jgi:hypothetical protein